MYRVVNTFLQSKRAGIFAQSDERGLRILREVNMLCVATERLESDRAGTGIEVGEHCPTDARLQDIEECFAQTIAGGSGFQTIWRDQFARAKLTGNDAHAFHLNCRYLWRASTLYNKEQADEAMRGWSFPLVRIMGLELRIHMFFVLLLGFCIVFANVAGISITRAVVLWLLVLLAVLVRETARIIAAIYLSLDLRNVLLLPIGGLFAYASPQSSERATEPRIVRSMAVVGPLANLGFAALLAAMIMAVAPGVPLFAKPWVTPLHLLRGAVCINLLLAGIHLLPAYPLDMGRVLRRAAGGPQALASRFSVPRMLTQTIPILLFVCGAMYQIPWMLVAGFFIPIAGHLDDQGMLFQSVVDTVRMGDIMLTDFSALSPSDTLEDALEKAIHSLQDDFPVVRGRNLVGVVSKQHILDALRSDGNGYVQGIMMRAFHVAQPDDSLGSAFRRITGGRGLSLVPIIEGERIVGIVTLQNLMHSMGLLSEGRRRREQEQ